MNPTSAPLPQLDGALFLSDGGIETDLIFNDGVELPEFASFVLLSNAEGIETLRNYFGRFMDVARAHRTGFIFESPTWRSSPDWGHSLGYEADQLREANRRAIELMQELRDELSSATGPIVISGCIGPRGDGYQPDNHMTAEEAAEYHRGQVDVFREAGTDMITAITMNTVAEATGVALAAKAAEMPCAIAFTVETDGRLPDGVPLLEAIEQLDAATDSWPAYFMISCAHPEHFVDALDADSPTTLRIRGIRANASRMSHAELDEAEELDYGNAEELGAQYAELRERFPQMNVFGGCCGTDVRHISAIAAACA